MNDYYYEKINFFLENLASLELIKKIKEISLEFDKKREKINECKRIISRNINNENSKLVVLKQRKTLPIKLNTRKNFSSRKV